MRNAHSSSITRWTWDDRLHPLVNQVFDEPSGEHEWCGYIEKTPADALVGKVLCVCVGLAIAKEVLSAKIGNTDSYRKAIEPLALLDQWIDDPTEERFKRICGLIFSEEQSLTDDLDPFGVVWWALRVATSSVGNYEAGWALKTVCSAAKESGFNDEALRCIAKRELLSRVHRG